MSPPICIGLIFGGVGPEHEASLSSARAVLNHLDKFKYRTKQFGACKDGSWLVGEGSWSGLYRMADQTMLPSDIVAQFANAGITREFASFPMEELDDVDCAFPVIHGTGGEDGSLQNRLSISEIPFCGSDAVGSLRAYNKWTAKQIARAAGLPVVRGLRTTRGETLVALRQRIWAELGSWNLVIKPEKSGSSFGVSRLSDPAQLPGALELAFTYDNAALVEQYLRHHELFVGVLGEAGEAIIASPVLDPDPKDSPSTYRDKYIDDRYPLQCPTGLDSSVDRGAKEMALTMFRAVGASGYARVDLFLCADTGRLFFNEINTIPALAVDCAFSMGMAHNGWSYKALLDEIVMHAFSRTRHRLPTYLTERPPIIPMTIPA